MRHTVITEVAPALIAHINSELNEDIDANFTTSEIPFPMDPPFTAEQWDMAREYTKEITRVGQLMPYIKSLDITVPLGNPSGEWDIVAGLMGAFFSRTRGPGYHDGIPTPLSAANMNKANASVDGRVLFILSGCISDALVNKGTQRYFGGYFGDPYDVADDIRRWMMSL